MVILPETITYAEAYLTLRCNLKCHYCINGYTGVHRKRPELSAKEWLMSLNNIKFGNLPLTFGGGEPTIHPGFYEILNGLNPEISVDLLTNGSFDLDEFIKKAPVDRFTKKEDSSYKSIRMSYHVKTSNAEDLVIKVAKLQKAGYSVGIFGLNHPENLRANVEMTELCRIAEVYFFVRDYLGWYSDRLYGYYKYISGLNGNKKPCKCKTSELLIGPEGHRYKCHKDLYDESNPIGDILRMDFSVEDKFYPCDSFGLCNPCDLKIKVSNNLQDSRCAVEIEMQE